MDDPRQVRERFNDIGEEIDALRLDCAAVQHELRGLISADDRRELLDMLHAMTREMRALADEAQGIVASLQPLKP